MRTEGFGINDLCSAPAERSGDGAFPCTINIHEQRTRQKPLIQNPHRHVPLPRHNLRLARLAAHFSPHFVKRKLVNINVGRARLCPIVN
jgi:hypothetical protein